MSAAEDANTWGENIHDLVDRDDPILKHFARFKDRFAEAMDGSLYTIEELEQRIVTRRAFLFPGENAAVITEPADYPGGTKAMHVLWACGDLEEIVALAPGIESLSRMMGCTRMIVEGHRAWERVLKTAGYRFFSVTLSKDI